MKIILANGFEEIGSLDHCRCLRLATDCDLVLVWSCSSTSRFPSDHSGSRPPLEWGLRQIMMESFYQVGCQELQICDNPEHAALQEESRKGKSFRDLCTNCLGAGLLKDKHYTCYDGFEAIQDGHYQKETVVKDGNLLTSRGPSTALALAWALQSNLGGDV